MPLNDEDRAVVIQALVAAQIIPAGFTHPKLDAFLNGLEHEDVSEITKISLNLQANKITMVLTCFPPGFPPIMLRREEMKRKPAKKKPARKRPTGKKPATKK